MGQLISINLDPTKDGIVGEVDKLEATSSKYVVIGTNAESRFISEKQFEAYIDELNDSGRIGDIIIKDFRIFYDKTKSIDVDDCKYEVIISALMSNGTIKAAAAAVGVTERTIYDRMSSGDFKALYKSAKADVVRKAIFDLNNQIGAAVETVVSIMQDDEINPAIRLQAAQTILNNANKFSERLNIDENSVSAQKESNAFDLFEF